MKKIQFEKLIKRGQTCNYTYYINYNNKRGTTVGERDKTLTINDDKTEEMSEEEVLLFVMKMIDNEKQYLVLKEISEKYLPQGKTPFKKVDSKNIDEWREQLKAYLKMYRFGEDSYKLFRIVETLVHSQAIYCDYREKESYFEEHLFVRL